MIEARMGLGGALGQRGLFGNEVHGLKFMRTELTVSYPGPGTGPGTQLELDKCWKNEGVVGAQGRLQPADSGSHYEILYGG